jgi:soluble lytic murein transglycosylase-like protein
MKRLPFALLAGMSAVGLTILSTMAGFAADLYTFHDEGGSAYYTNVRGLGRGKVRLPLKQLRPRKKSALSQGTGDASNLKSDYGEVIQSACERFTVDPDLVRAVIKAESNFNSEAVSPKGAMGLMQLMPDTAQEMGVSDPFDPVENIHGGVGYLSRLLNNLNGDFSLALAAYNAGPERVKNYKGIPPFRETWNYIERVMSYYQLFKGKD